MKSLLIVLLVYLSIQNVYSAMSEAQMKAALKLVRNVCQPKFKTTNEQIDAMHKGDWNQDKAGQCYMWCIINMYKMLTKENKFDWESSITQIQNQAPLSMRDPAIVSVKNCKNAVKTPTDKCVAGFEIAKCLYDDNPKNYFLP